MFTRPGASQPTMLPESHARYGAPLFFAYAPRAGMSPTFCAILPCHASVVPSVRLPRDTEGRQHECFSAEVGREIPPPARRRPPCSPRC